MSALRNKLKRLEELIIQQKYEEHVVLPYTPLELWQEVRDGHEDKVFPLVSSDMRRLLLWIKKTELPGHPLETEARGEADYLDA
mgnify:CR=1 FL=1